MKAGISVGFQLRHLTKDEVLTEIYNAKVNAVPVMFLKDDKKILGNTKSENYVGVVEILLKVCDDLMCNVVI